MEQIFLRVIFGIVLLHFTEAAVGDACTDNAGCTGLANTECSNAKCECTGGFAKKIFVCIKTVSGTTCTANGNECDSITNSHCNTDKCACNDGFVMNMDVCTAENGGSVTPTVKVSETTCTKDAGNQCQHTPYAECNNNAQGAKCTCSSGYAENRSDGTTCVKTVSATACTANGNECNSIANSRCNTDKCACSDGFVMNVDVCTAGNGAAMFEFGAVLLAVSLLTTYLV